MKSDVERKLQAHKRGFFGAGQVSWKRNPLIFLIFLQDILKTAFQVRIQPINARKQGIFFKTRLLFVCFQKR